MKKFVSKIFLFLLLFILISLSASALFFYKITPQYETGYNASILDKSARLNSINGPKIVLIGDSNVSFGFQSDLIEQAYGVPVVNMGLHGGLGNAFHEEMAKMNVQEGDIYVICHHTFADNGKIDDTELAWITLENHFDLWSLPSVQDIPGMAKAFPSYIKKASVLWAKELINPEAAKSADAAEATTCYSRSAFNQCGDDIFPRENGTFTFTTQSVPEMNDTCINRLNKLNAYLAERGATMVVAGYPIGKGEFTPPEEEYVEFQQKLSDRLDCQVISDYRDYFFDYSYFYNTELHLTNDGARLRTEQLIKDLEKVVELDN